MVMRFYSPAEQSVGKYSKNPSQWELRVHLNEAVPSKHLTFLDVRVCPILVRSQLTSYQWPGDVSTIIQDMSDTDVKV